LAGAGDHGVDRREFLESIAGLSALGLALLPLRAAAFAAELHARAQAAPGLRTLTPELDATLSGIADILLPESDTVGASAVGVNRFIDLLLTESMLESDRDRFIEGLRAIDAECQASQGVPFASAPRGRQEEVVRGLDAHLTGRPPTRAETAALNARPVSAAHGYALAKQLLLLAYFTSEPVARDVIKAPIIPGRYDGCVST
jgi:hypothetical protein